MQLWSPSAICNGPSCARVPHLHALHAGRRQLRTSGFSTVIPNGPGPRRVHFRITPEKIASNTMSRHDGSDHDVFSRDYRLLLVSDLDNTMVRTSAIITGTLQPLPLRDERTFEHSLRVSCRSITKIPTTTACESLVRCGKKSLPMIPYLCSPLGDHQPCTKI